MAIKIKRAYEPPSKSDGARVLIDGLWPRGVTKEKAEIAEWMKEIAASAALRKWFSHDPAKWPEFKKRYRAELARNPGAVARLRETARKGTLTIVYGAKDEEHNNAVVLKEFLEEERPA
jgi:uncharacterized protein YeaO (DUF488 family)